MVYEANARIRDPVYGCVGAISCLQQQVDTLQKQLAQAQAELVYLRLCSTEPQADKRKTTSSFFTVDDMAMFEHHSGETDDADTSLGAFWSE